MKKIIRLDVVLKGLAMGIAEVIPGVSGGTIAFVTGIYAELMSTITSFNLEWFKKLFSGKLSSALSSLNLSFISSLGIGMVTGIVFGVFVISHLLEFYPEPLWGFFFGLILASAIYIAKQSRWDNFISVISLVAGLSIALYISFMSPSEGIYTKPFIFMSGIIAISAMLLPGISGSFMLVLLGMYSFILGNVKNLLTSFDTASLTITLVFMMGLITGAATFSRIFSWLFEKYKNPTLALLTGFLLGSLPKIWPWKNVSMIYDKENDVFVNILNGDMLGTFAKDQYKVVSEAMVLPGNYWATPHVWMTVFVAILGFLLVFLVEYRTKD